MSKKRRVLISYIALIMLLLLLVVVSIAVGSVKISLSDLWHILLNRDNSETLGKIVLDIRLPRILEAVILGGALALSGYLLQSFFSNPIAGPFVLGISSGAKLLVAILMIAAMEGGFALRSSYMVATAFIGSLLVTGFVLAVASKIRNMSILIVCGVMIGYICSSATELLVTFADDSNIVNLHNWSMGTYSAASWMDARLYVPIIVICVVAAFFMSKMIEATSYGNDYASSIGVNVRVFRITLIIVSSLLSATVTAFAGPVSFIGIAVPHMIRTIFKTEKPLIVIPGCFLGGALFSLFSDLCARSLFAPTELSISTITAIFGAPVVISMLIGKKKNNW